MIREVTVKIYFDIDEEMAKANLLKVTPLDKVEQMIEDQLTEIYCEDIGFEHLKVRCHDYNEEESLKMREFLRGLRKDEI